MWDTLFFVPLVSNAGAYEVLKGFGILGGRLEGLNLFDGDLGGGTWFKACFASTMMLNVWVFGILLDGLSV